MCRRAGRRYSNLSNNLPTNSLQQHEAFNLQIKLLSLKILVLQAQKELVGT